MAIVRVYRAEDDGGGGGDTASGGGETAGGVEAFGSDALKNNSEMGVAQAISDLSDQYEKVSTGKESAPLKYGPMPAQTGGGMAPTPAGGTPLTIPPGPRNYGTAPPASGGMLSEIGKFLGMDKGTSPRPGVAADLMASEGLETPPPKLMPVMSTQPLAGLHIGGDKPLYSGMSQGESAPQAPAPVSPPSGKYSTEETPGFGVQKLTDSPFAKMEIPAENSLAIGGVAAEKKIAIPEGWKEISGVGPAGEKMIQRVWTDANGVKHGEIKPLAGTEDEDRVKAGIRMADEARVDEIMKQGRAAEVRKEEAFGMVKVLYDNITRGSYSPEAKEAMLRMAGTLSGIAGMGGAGGGGGTNLGTIVSKKQAEAAKEETAAFNKQQKLADTERKKAEAKQKEADRVTKAGATLKAAQRTANKDFEAQVKAFGKMPDGSVSYEKGILTAKKNGQTIPAGWEEYADTVLAQVKDRIALIQRRLGRELRPAERDDQYKEAIDQIQARAGG